MNASVGPGIVVNTNVEVSLRDFGRTAAPDECCGILGGVIGLDHQHVIQVALPVVNYAANRSRAFVIAPTDIVAAENRFAEAQLDLIGFFHSHPGGRAEPSRSDIADASAWPGFVHCVIGVGMAETKLGWFLTGDPWVSLDFGGMAP